MIKEGVHYSLSTDDPILTGAYLGNEYQFAVDKLGATWTDVHQAVSINQLSAFDGFLQ